MYLVYYIDMTQKPQLQAKSISVEKVFCERLRDWDLWKKQKVETGTRDTLGTQ